MNAKRITSTFAFDQPKKNPLNSKRDNSIYLDGHDEPLDGAQKGLEKMEASGDRFQEFYCIKQPR